MESQPVVRPWPGGGVGRGSFITYMYDIMACGNAVYAMLFHFVRHNGVFFELGTCFAEGYVAWALRSTP